MNLNNNNKKEEENQTTTKEQCPPVLLQPPICQASIQHYPTATYQYPPIPQVQAFLPTLDLNNHQQQLSQPIPATHFNPERNLLMEIQATLIRD